jgi:hypothetical protein
MTLLAFNVIVANPAGDGRGIQMAGPRRTDAVDRIGAVLSTADAAPGHLQGSQARAEAGAAHPQYGVIG